MLSEINGQSFGWIEKKMSAISAAGDHSFYLEKYFCWLQANQLHGYSKRDLAHHYWREEGNTTATQKIPSREGTEKRFNMLFPSLHTELPEVLTLSSIMSSMLSIMGRLQCTPLILK